MRGEFRQIRPVGAAQGLKIQNTQIVKINFTTHKLNIGMILSSPSVVAVRLYACQTLGLTKLLLCF